MRDREYAVRADGIIVGLRPDGTTVALTLEEAVRAQQEIARQKAPHQDHAPNNKVVARKSIAVRVPVRNDVELERRGREFIRLVATGGKAGTETTKITKELNLKSGKAISGYARAAYQLVGDKIPSRKRTDIIWKSRSRVRGHIWHADVDMLKEAGLV